MKFSRGGAEIEQAYWDRPTMKKSVCCCLSYSKQLADVARQVLYTGMSDLFHPWPQNRSDMMKLVSVLFQAIERISQTNKNTLSEAWNKSEKHRIRQKAKKFGCLSYSTPISQTGISQKGNFWVSGLFQGQKVSGLFCTLRGKWVSGLFWGRISGLFCGLVWLSIVTPIFDFSERIVLFSKSRHQFWKRYKSEE